MTNEELQAQINTLKQDLQALNDEVYRNNFSAHTDYNKTSYFNSRLKIPVVTALPTKCEIGEIISYGGKLYVASATNTWTIAGLQS